MRSLFLLLLIHLWIPVVLSEEPVRKIGRDVSSYGRGSVPKKTSLVAESTLETHQVVVHIPNSENYVGVEKVQRIAQENGFRFVKSLKGPALRGYYIFERDLGKRKEPHPLSQDDRVEWWSENIPKQRIKRSWVPPSDPLYQSQWHLPILNAQSVWKDGITGQGINIAVVDDGLQKNHPDLSGNYNVELSWDFNDDDDDPSPKYGDSHGTSASGVAAAVRDNKCGVGVAYGASLSGLRLLGRWESDATEAEALSHKCSSSHAKDRIDIYSCSWGPTDDGKDLEGPGRIVRDTFDHCIEQGRGGLGTIYVWAGGNGRYNNDNSNYDGFANSPYTIAVGAINHNGLRTWYSEPGSNLMCVAPSSGSNMRIVTTDLLGRSGASNGDCTWDFGGTSAAAPEVAGATALILQANPGLNWRQVQDVIAQSSYNNIPEGGLNEPFTMNAAGLKHSHDLGFGVVDVRAAVRLARGGTYNESHPMAGDSLAKHLTTGTLQSPQRVVQPRHGLILYWDPDNVRHAMETIPNGLEHVLVTVDLDTPGRSQCLRLELIGPSGVNSTLSESGNGMETRVQWTYMSVRHWGEPFKYDPNADKRPQNKRRGANLAHPARWSIRIVNVCKGDDRTSFTIRSWRLDFYGH